MICRGISDPVRARDEDLKRRDPVEFERRKAEAYVMGAGNPAPAVVTFPTFAAHGINGGCLLIPVPASREFSARDPAPACPPFGRETESCFFQLRRPE